MQRENDHVDCGDSNEGEFLLPYSSAFSSCAAFPNSISVIPSDDCSGFEDSSGKQAMDLSLSQHSRLVRDYVELLDRHGHCVAQLQETAVEAEDLRLENSDLHHANRELSNHLNLLIKTSLAKGVVSQDVSSMSLMEDFHRLCLGDTSGGKSARVYSNISPWDDVNDGNPMSLISNDRMEGIGKERPVLPKSISVRSSDYLKAGQGGGNNLRANRHPARPRTTSPASRTTQKVFVQGGAEPEEEAPLLEMEVYNQGMLKTELCNKWQETHTCPYGGNCQFAHGIKELRPVIRHPRYKTEVCRMVLAGDKCPYGHRCHFRHALTDEEKLIGAPLRDDRSTLV